jgi:hypothetical protein
MTPKMTRRAALASDQDTGEHPVLMLAPIAGGCDDIPAEYHPTESDWASYREWADEIDRGDVEPDDHKRLGIVSRDFAERLAYGHLG